MNAELAVRTSPDGRAVEVVASGAWTVASAEALEPLVDRAVKAAPDAELRVDAAGIDALDTFGACLLERFATRQSKPAADLAPARPAPAGLVPVGIAPTGLADRFWPLLNEIRRGAARQALGAPRTPVSMWSTLQRGLSDAGRDLVAFVALLGALGEALALSLIRPRTFRLTSFVHQIDRVGLRAVPIILMITFLIGGIIAQQGIFHFRRFGAGDYVVDLVGILVLREIGVLLVAIMVAGRSGSAYTAELGSMVMREEVDALRTMGVDPVAVLVLPRVLALVVALPILTFLGSMAALIAGGLVAWLYGGMSPWIYVARLQEAISLTHFQVGMWKAPFMALVIGIVACTEGLLTRGSAESLGLQTTSSVVRSIFLVIVLDGLFAVFFASIGM